MASKIIPVQIPKDVAVDLLSFVQEVADADEGITEETYEPTSSDALRLQRVAGFARSIRARLLHHVGAVRITGLDNRYQPGRWCHWRCRRREHMFTTRRAKLAHYILSSLIGRVDGTARGRLFDVMDGGLDVKADNTTFSALLCQQGGGSLAHGRGQRQQVV
jgi:hypothetical protein